MKKLVFCVAVLAITTLSANAQKESSSSDGFKIGAGATVGLPLGTIKSYTSFVFGVDLQGEYPAAESVGITVSAGYLNFSGKSGAGSTGSIPVLAGAKIKFAEKVYGHAQLGMSFSTQSGGGSAFTYAPSIGYQAAENVDVSVRYQAATKSGSTNSFIGLRVGFTF